MPRQPLRRCRVCRKQLPKNELLRWTVSAGVLMKDLSQTAQGYGYYSCSIRCSENLAKTIKGLKKT